VLVFALQDVAEHRRGGGAANSSDRARRSLLAPSHWRPSLPASR
jgi:hypothetical protein